jgi:hypothetical protein
MEFGGLNETNLVNKLVCFGADIVIIFQEVKNGVIAQIMQKHAPFVNGLHCMAHCTNMVV